MKKLITTVALIATVVASPASAMYHPGPTTGSASNEAEHALGYYVTISGYMRPPPIHDIVSHPSDQFQSDALQAEIFGGCGTHRYYNPESKVYRGPGDD